jgi:hypothetical protein
MTKAARTLGLLLLYLWVTVGMTVATHFCAGEPMSATLLAGAGQGAPCCCGDAGDMGGCCSTSVTTLRVDDAHAASAESFSATVTAEMFPAAEYPSLLQTGHSLPAEIVRPPGPQIPLHILDCSFLI